MDACNEVWETMGLPTLTGHSFRIGGTSELLACGVPPDIVAAQGSWRSRAFLAYWRKVERVLPLFVYGDNVPSL